MSTGPTSSSIDPLSTFDRSSTSSTSDSRWRPDSAMSSVYATWRSSSGPISWSCRTSANPRMALSGVRSSCDIRARNSLLARLTTTRPALASSAASRASCSAMTSTPMLCTNQRTNPEHVTTAAISPTHHVSGGW
jgi:hypothetical protein